MGHLYFLSVQQKVVIYNRCQCVTRVCTCALGEVMGPYSSNRLVSPSQWLSQNYDVLPSHSQCPIPKTGLSENRAPKSLMINQKESIIFNNNYSSCSQQEKNSFRVSPISDKTKCQWINHCVEALIGEIINLSSVFTGFILILGG